MALTTVSVYKRTEGNNLGTNGAQLTSPKTEGFETTNVLWFGPSTCGLEAGGNDFNSAIVSRIVLKGVSGTSMDLVTLYTNSSVATIAGLT
jgi:hypothetical protein